MKTASRCGFSLGMPRQLHQMGSIRPRSVSSAGIVGVLKGQMACQVWRIGVAQA